MTEAIQQILQHELKADCSQSDTDSNPKLVWQRVSGKIETSHQDNANQSLKQNLRNRKAISRKSAHPDVQSIRNHCASREPPKACLMQASRSANCTRDCIRRYEGARRACCFGLSLGRKGRRHHWLRFQTRHGKGTNFRSRTTKQMVQLLITQRPDPCTAGKSVACC